MIKRMEYRDIERYAAHYFRENVDASWRDAMANALIQNRETIERFACEQRQEHYYPTSIK